MNIGISEGMLRLVSHTCFRNLSYHVVWKLLVIASFGSPVVIGNIDRYSIIANDTQSS